MRRLVGVAIAGVIVSSFAADSARVRRPAGFIRMDVVGTTETDLGPTLFLTDLAREVLVPVPLDQEPGDEVAALSDLGRLRETRVESRDGVWTVTLVLEDGAGRHEVVAPASALSLAEANRDAPVWLARSALDDAGLWRNPRKRVSLGRDLRDGQRELATELGI